MAQCMHCHIQDQVLTPPEKIERDLKKQDWEAIISWKTVAE